MKADRLIKVTAGVLIVGTLAACSGTSIEATSTPQPTEPERPPTHLPTDAPTVTTQPTNVPPTVPESPTTQPTETVVVDAYGRKLLFAANPEGQLDIFIMDVDPDTGATSNIQNLTDTSNANEYNPQPSPDGKDIVFTREPLKDGDSEIIQLNLESGKETQLTDNDATDFDAKYSPDKKHIFWQSNKGDGYGDFWEMDSDGQNQRNITPDLSTSAEWGMLSFANDHEAFATIQKHPEYEDQNKRDASDEVGLFNLETGAVKELTHNEKPDWYPEKCGEKVDFVSTEDPTKKEPHPEDNIYQMDLNGKNRTPFINLLGDDDDPFCSADGLTFFVNNGNGEYDIFVRLADGTIKRITNTPYKELSPVEIQLPAL